MLAAGINISVPSATWTLLAQSPVGNNILQYDGFVVPGTVSCKARVYIAAGAHAVGVDPTGPQFRHSYITSPSDRTAFVADKPEVMLPGVFAFLEVFQESGTPQVFDGTLLGG